MYRQVRPTASFKGEMRVLPLSGHMGRLDFVELILDGLFGSDLGIQCRLQLQTGRHVQLSKTSNLPWHVLENQKKGQLNIYWV